jgi:multidrug efflux pump subunit AcrA (membrane-fusion protein)
LWVESWEAAGMAKRSLFREEVIQAQHNQELGSVHLAVPLSFRRLIFLTAGFVTAITLFLVFGHYTPYRRISGQLVPSTGFRYVHSPIAGKVQIVYVHDGEVVRRDQPLAKISSISNDNAFNPTQNLINAQLLKALKRLQTPLAVQKVSASQKTNLIAAQMAIEQALSENKQLTKHEAQTSVVLRAPADGVISVVPKKAGQIVELNQLLFSEYSKNPILQAVLLVPGSAVNYAKRGDKVVLHYQDFPYQEFGEQYGHVVDVSDDKSSKNEFIDPSSADDTPRKQQRLIVRLDHASINAEGKNYALKPGMILSAEISLGRQSLWQLAFVPTHKRKSPPATKQGS